MDKPTRKLPYGKQRLLEIALALATRPRVLLLDEPAAGVPEEERRDILAALAALPSDVAILLIEHDMDLVFNFADRISVLVAGKLLTEGRAGGDRRRRARARGLSGRGRAWLSSCGSRTSARAMARRESSMASVSRFKTASRWRCLDATASARRRFSIR